MTAKSTWTPMIADAYASKYGEVVQDFLSLVVEPSLTALEQKGVEIAAREGKAHRMYGGPYTKRQVGRIEQGALIEPVVLRDTRLAD